MKEHLSLSRRIHNANASIEVENVKARHQYLHARCDGVGEYANLWVRSDEAGWGHGFGCMVGFEQIWNGSVTCYDRMAFQNWIELVDVYPEVSGKDPRPLMEASVHTLVTDVIEVADDGMSVRGSFITPGVIHCTLNQDKKKTCTIMWERYGSDFVLDNGEWKYLNEQVCPDIVTPMDFLDWAAEDYKRQTDPNPVLPQGGGAVMSFPPVTYPGPWHNDYTVIQTPQDDTPWPEPYVTLDAENRYNKPR